MPVPRNRGNIKPDPREEARELSDDEDDRDPSWSDDNGDLDEFDSNVSRPSDIVYYDRNGNPIRERNYPVEESDDPEELPF